MDSGRRSGRIAKEIAILLLGTDPNGRVFSEETKTVVLSRHGAGILSRHSFAPEEILMIRTLVPCKEAEIRVIGQIVRGPDGHVYGVTFTNPDLDFWQIEFPPPPAAPEPAEVVLECHLCHNRHIVEPSGVESGVYTSNGSILRPCEICGVTTNWERADPNADPALSPRRMAAPDRSRASQPAYGAPTSANTTPQPVASIPETAAAVTALGDEPLPQATSRRSSPASNRRLNKRVGVKFTACVRHPGSGDDIVECNEVSKGGLSFRSRKHYRVNSLIETAVPYSRGQTPIFVSASIIHAEKPPGSNFYCYGAAYAKAR
jgi:hypothetical protein